MAQDVARNQSRDDRWMNVTEALHVSIITGRPIIIDRDQCRA